MLGALRRTVQLGRTDYVHAAGSFAALALLFGLTRLALGLLLHNQADTTVRDAIFLADVVTLTVAVSRRGDRVRRPRRACGRHPRRSPQAEARRPGSARSRL